VVQGQPARPQHAQVAVAPVQAGNTGSALHPVAITTAAAVIGSVAVVTTKPSQSASTRRASTPVRISSRSPSA
jgi:hypothetical protein